MVYAPALFAQDGEISAKNDYVTCWKQPCVYSEGSKWSENNPNGVAISIRMGKKAAVTDNQIKQVLTADLRHYGVSNIKFFYEKFEGNSSAISLHVRGGTEGIFTIANVRGEIEAISKRAKNTNPVFRSS